MFNYTRIINEIVNNTNNDTYKMNLKFHYYDLLLLLLFFIFLNIIILININVFAIIFVVIVAVCLLLLLSDAADNAPKKPRLGKENLPIVCVLPIVTFNVICVRITKFFFVEIFQTIFEIKFNGNEIK